MTEVPIGTEYRGPSGVARDSNWLTNEDLPHDKDTLVTVESVLLRRNVVMKGGRPKKVALSIKFVGKDRELVVNATNRQTMDALFGPGGCGQWFGKRIALFVEQDVRRPDGTRGPAVRIRPKRIEQATPATPDTGTDA